jgi:hypothetical protein
MAQSKKNDIPVSQLPSNVKNVLNKYVQILGSGTLDQVANNFASIAGGGLVNEQGNQLRSSVKPYSLKKDWQNIKFYAYPVQITRVNKSHTNGTGYGASALKGTVYKIWIAKKNGQAGMPAPISIIVPEGHPTIKSPKVIGIGSL